MKWKEVEIRPLKISKPLKGNQLGEKVGYKKNAPTGEEKPRMCLIFTWAPVGGTGVLPLKIYKHGLSVMPCNHANSKQVH